MLTLTVTRRASFRLSRHFSLSGPLLAPLPACQLPALPPTHYCVPHFRLAPCSVESCVRATIDATQGKGFPSTTSSSIYSAGPHPILPTSLFPTLRFGYSTCKLCRSRRTRRPRTKDIQRIEELHPLSKGSTPPLPLFAAATTLSLHHVNKVSQLCLLFLPSWSLSFSPGRASSYYTLLLR